MQHQNRDQFIASVAEVIAELYGQPPTLNLETTLRQRLNPLLDSFLFESQAIVATEATILIADIRGFTSLTEFFPPPALIASLNRYFQTTSELVNHHGGWVDKFMGDAVMALFGVPQSRPDDLKRALICAVDMQRSMARINREAEANGEPSLYIGIAVNTGKVMAGSFGSSVYNEYTVIGDAVNLTSRMEAYSLRGQILLSEASYEASRDFVEIGAVNQVQVKGKSQPVTLYELRAIKHPVRLEVPPIEIRKSPRVQVDLPLAFRRVECKRILTERYFGRVNDLGYFGMNADLPLILPPHTEILINLLGAGMSELGLETTSDVYARVLRCHQIPGAYRTHLEFTSIGTHGHQQLKHYIDQLLWRR